MDKRTENIETVLGADVPESGLSDLEFLQCNYIAENRDTAMSFCFEGAPLREKFPDLEEQKFAPPGAQNEATKALLSKLFPSTLASDGKTSVASPELVKLLFLRAFDQEAVITTMVANVELADTSDDLAKELKLNHLKNLGCLVGVVGITGTTEEQIRAYQDSIFLGAPSNIQNLLGRATQELRKPLAPPIAACALMLDAKLPWVRQRLAESYDPETWRMAVLDNFNASPKDVFSGILMLEGAGVSPEVLRKFTKSAWARPDFVSFMQTKGELAKHSNVHKVELAGLMKFSPSIAPEESVPLF